MKVRHPPGRAGRPWLQHRLELARRGAELLDEKFRALTRERQRLEPLVVDARSEWHRRAQEAGRWLTRALVLGGERQLSIVRPPAAAPADVEVHWRTILGVRLPTDARISTRPDPELSARGANAALLVAADAHRRALEAATRLAVLDGALHRVADELRATALRRNAVQRRWIPAHEAALATLEVTLEELEREDGIRVRWVTGGSPGQRADR